MHELLRNNNEVFRLYTDYVKATAKNYPEAHLFPFSEVYDNVVNGLAEYCEPTSNDILANIKSVLKAMVYTSSNRMEDMFERAEKHTKENYHNCSKLQENYR